MKELQETIVTLLLKQPFYAHLIMQMKQIIGTKVPTAGVRIMSDKIELIVNPEFFKSLSPEARVAVLIHECEHIIRAHPARSKMGTGVLDYSEHQTWNIAADCAINQYIPSMEHLKSMG